jgi:hypothetical protein
LHSLDIAVFNPATVAATPSFGRWRVKREQSVKHVDSLVRNTDNVDGKRYAVNREFPVLRIPALFSLRC